MKLKNATTIDILESFVKQIKDGVIEVTQFDLRDGDVLVHQTCGIVDRCIVTDKIIEMRYKAIPPKKTQQEVYKQLFDTAFMGYAGDNEHKTQMANIFASKNTVKVWREQWKK